MGLSTSTTKQTAKAAEFTDFPIVTQSLLIFSKGFHFNIFDRIGDSNPRPTVPEAEPLTTRLFDIMLLNYCPKSLRSYLNKSRLSDFINETASSIATKQDTYSEYICQTSKPAKSGVISVTSLLTMEP